MEPIHKPVRTRRLLSSVCKYELGQAKRSRCQPEGEGWRADTQEGAVAMAGSGGSPQKSY